jgi:tungstate transport system ATP-binding protein
MTMAELFHLNHVRSVYGKRTVLDIADLSLSSGEFFALVGPSGAGKSTLLRLLNFLEAPTAGSLTFDGQPVPLHPPLSLFRRVTMVFQRPLLLQRSVRENVAYGLRVRGLPADERVEAMLERVGLKAFASQSAHKLSGGELQRAALARALVLDPDVLLLDEPTANLDPYNVGLIETIVREENQTRGIMVVLVTHNVFQARRLAHRVGLLLEGLLVEVAPTETFFQSPRDPRTAAFVRGEMVY